MQRDAKEAAKRNNTDIPVPHSKTEMESRPTIKHKRKWQKLWKEKRTGRRFYKIQRKVDKMRRTGRQRKEESEISRGLDTHG